MSFWPFGADRLTRDAQRLLEQVSAASRNPALFGDGRAPDTLQGRFEVLTLFATLAVIKLRASGAEALAQRFSDLLFRSVDAGLREAGVGDLAVPKRMHRLAGEVLGRSASYMAALSAGDRSGLEAALQRNIAGMTPAFATELAQGVAELAARQGEIALDLLFVDEGWRGGGD